MRSGRLELPHPRIRVPKTRASTNSATTAQFNIKSGKWDLKIFIVISNYFFKLKSFKLKNK